MKHKTISINAIVMTLALSFMAVGTFTTSLATAATAEVTSGTWIKKSKAIKGGWSIEKRGDQHVISTGGNATDGAELVAVLKSTKGSQEYVIPSNIDVSSFNSLLIHCEAYSVLWGGTDIATL